MNINTTFNSSYDLGDLGLDVVILPPMDILSEINERENYNKSYWLDAGLLK